MSEYMASLTFVAFDTETTGIWAPSNRLVEIGAVKFNLANDETEQFNELINPRRFIPPEAIKIHGITDEMVEEVDTASGVLQRFVSFCGADSLLIAHNAQFDISHVGCELNRYNIPFGDNLILDSVEIFRRYFPGLQSYSLISLGQIFKVAEKQNHRALADAMIVHDLFLIATHKFPRVDSLDRLKVSFETATMSNWRPGDVRLPGQYADISRAIDERLPLEIIYSSQGNPPTLRIIRPLQVHMLRDQFYINAYCDDSDTERTFRLDRIQSYRVVG